MNTNNLRGICGKLGFQDSEACLERAKNALENGPVVPLKLEIHTHEDCICNCLFCINRDWRNGKSKEELTQLNLPRSILDKIVEDAKVLGIKQLSFSGGGEPLLNSNTLDAIKKANSLGISTKLVTNGFLLDENAFQVLLNSNQLRISLNAASEKTFRLVQQPPGEMSLVSLLEKIDYFVKLRNSSQSKAEVWLSYQVIKKNSKELAEFATLAEKAGVDAVLFEFPYSVSPELACHQNEANKIVKQIEQLSKKFKGRMKIFFPEETINYLKGGKKFKHCIVPYFKLTISAKGGIFPCCQLADQGGEKYEKYALGKLDEKNSMKKIINSPKARKIVKNLNSDNCPDCIPSELKMNTLFAEWKK